MSFEESLRTVYKVTDEELYELKVRCGEDLSNYYMGALLQIVIMMRMEKMSAKIDALSKRSCNEVGHTFFPRHYWNFDKGIEETKEECIACGKPKDSK